MTLAVLIARQRTGTGALGSTLDQNPSIAYKGEVFHHDAVERPPNYFWFFRKLIAEHPDMIMPNAGPARWDRYAEYIKSTTAKPHAILDIKYSSTHHFNKHWLGPTEAPTLFQILRAKNVPVIQLLRSNQLKVFISGKLAEANGIWHTKTADRLKVTTLKIDTRACINFVSNRLEEDERVRRALKDHKKLLVLEYAQLFGPSGTFTEETASKLAAFFGLATPTFKSPATVKQTSDRLKDVIENYDEVNDAFLRTPHSWMLDAG
jgi:hypothetical protein